ncbi:hypothetical protein [Hyalangium sp.]|uniref:hypothetical protein n=1 Tax=Hyalangium sp. TaxID=2028555 RepID=UPI002D2F99D7|nr:hypothetical protein [Hyalangium sp.]HYH97251.1 hypothetical protein [Hyalangium sp.]
MTLPSRKLLMANAACLLLLAWLYGGDVSDALQARSAEVSAFTELPPLGRPSSVLVLGALALGAALWGLLRRQGDDYKGYRLLPIVLVGALFVDLVFAEQRSPFDSLEVASRALGVFQEQAQQLATSEAVPADPAVLSPLLESLGRPPYLVRGQPASRYTLQVRQDCESPVRLAPGLQPGTLIYCVDPGRKGASIALVGLPAGKRFGKPELLSVNGEPIVAPVALVAPAIPGEVGDDSGAPPALFREPGPPGEEPPAPSGERKDADPGP